MHVSDVLKTRRTIRGFKPEPVPRELVLQILEPALAAPSWANTQPWEVFVAAGAPLERLRAAYAENLRKCIPRNPDIAMPKEWSDACRSRMEELKTERAEALAQSCPDPDSIPDLMVMNYKLFGAPVVVYLCMDRCLGPWSLFDLGALSQSIMLSAEERGIGSAVAVTLAAHPDLIRRELSVPDNLAVVIGIALGHPDPACPQNKFRSARRASSDVIRFVGF